MSLQGFIFAKGILFYANAILQLQTQKKKKLHETISGGIIQVLRQFIIKTDLH